MQVKVIQREFDEVAPVYETNRLSSWYQAHADEILRQCPPLPTGDILDVGCGTGYFLRSYLARNPHARGVGIDVSEGMVEAARARAEAEQIANVEFVGGDFERVDLQLFAAYRFSIIVCANAFHYFSDPQSATDRLYRLLGNDGVLFILERDKSSSLLTQLWGFLHRYYIKDQVEFYDKDELLKFVERAGFRDLSVVNSIRRYFWRGKLYTSVVLIRCRKAGAGN